MSDRPPPFWPAWLDDGDLDPLEVRVLLHVLRRSSKSGEFYESRERTGDALELAERTVRATFRRLEARGIVVPKTAPSRGRFATTYTTADPSSWVVNPAGDAGSTRQEMPRSASNPASGAAQPGTVCRPTRHETTVHRRRGTKGRGTKGREQPSARSAHGDGSAPVDAPSGDRHDGNGNGAGKGPESKTRDLRESPPSGDAPGSSRTRRTGKRRPEHRPGNSFDPYGLAALAGLRAKGVTFVLSEDGKSVHVEAPDDLAPEDVARLKAMNGWGLAQHLRAEAGGPTVEVLAGWPGTWSREACEDWTERFGGVAEAGRIGKALKALQRSHPDWQEVRAAWRNYLAQAEAEYVTPSRFAATFGRWNGSAPEATKASAVGQTLKAVESMFRKMDGGR